MTLQTYSKMYSVHKRHDRSCQEYRLYAQPLIVYIITCMTISKLTCITGWLQDGEICLQALNMFNPIDQHIHITWQLVLLVLINGQKIRRELNITDSYSKLGHKFFKKLVWKKSSSRQPTVRAGGPVKCKHEKFKHLFPFIFSHYLGRVIGHTTHAASSECQYTSQRTSFFFSLQTPFNERNCLANIVITCPSYSHLCTIPCCLVFPHRHPNTNDPWRKKC